MVHHLLTVWFEFVLQWHYLGIFLLMALESTVFPIPSEIIIPPAAYWAAQGSFDFWPVVIIGTCGAYAGSVLSYGVARWLGRPLLSRYGSYVGLTPQKLVFLEDWIRKHGAIGIFVGRLLPVVRHLISLPAGLLHFPFFSFSVVTFLGAGFWSLCLAWFGIIVIGDEPQLLENPSALVHALKAKLIYVVAACLLLLTLYILVRRLMHKKNKN